MLGLLLFLMLLYGIGISPLFNIQTVEVIGVTRYPQEKLIAASGMQTGVNYYQTLGPKPLDMLTFRNRSAESQIRSNFPYVEDVVVHLIPFGKVRIKVQERVPLIAVAYMESYLMMDHRGICLEFFESSQAPSVPVLLGSKVKDWKLGGLIIFEDPYIMDSIHRLYDFIGTADSSGETKLLPLITEIDFSQPEDARVTLDHRIRVNIGDVYQLGNYKINFIKEIFFKKIQKEEKGSLDFSKDENPVFTPE